MKILVFSDIPPHVIGGAEMQAARLAHAWQASGHEVLVVGHRIPDGETEGIETRRLPVIYPLGRGLRGLTLFLSITRLMLGPGRGYDLAYCRFLGEAALSLVMLKALRLTRIPIVVTPGAAGNTDKSDMAFLYHLPGNARLIRLINRHCEVVNCIAPEIKASLALAGVHTRIESEIPNGVPAASVYCSGPQDVPHRLVFVGRLARQKGLDVLFDALVQLRELPVWQLDILGEGPDATELMARSQRLGLTGRVHFLGVRSPAEVRAHLLHAHLFVLPSRYEGLSNAVLEALSLGLPCILTRCGGIDTYIDQYSGWVCTPEDPADLAAALRQGLALERQAWLERSHRSIELVRRHFDLDNCARRHIELFEKLIAED